MFGHRSVRVISVILLLWNLMGLAAFVMQYRMDPGELARTDPDMARAFSEMPGWVWIAYALAVSAGTVGAILLVRRKAGAVVLFLLSLIGVLVQFGYTLGATDLIARKGVAAAAGFPAIIILIAVGQFAYARALHARGLLR